MRNIQERPKLVSRVYIGEDTGLDPLLCDHGIEIWPMHIDCGYCQQAYDNPPIQWSIVAVWAVTTVVCIAFAMGVIFTVLAVL